MDIIICVNHGKMDGTNIVVNATIFNDSLHKFRFRCDNGGWVYADNISQTNKCEDVFFDELNQDIPHRIICQSMIDSNWVYMGNIITTTSTNVLYDITSHQQDTYTYKENHNEIEVSCEVM